MPARPSGDALLTVVLELVSDRTGYPVDMLDPDLDLEADLSIDSIKRIEIIGELAEAIGLGAAGDAIDESVVEELAALKSLRGIVAWIDASADLLGAPDVGAAPAPGGAAPRPSGDALLTVVLELVSDRTGYPVDMLDPDLDLEADLSIDSIKRIEIIGELAEAIGLGAAGDAIDESVVEELAALKSLRGIVAWIDAFGGGPDGSRAAADARAGDRAPAAEGPPVPPAAVRHEVEVLELGPVTATADLADQRVALVVPAGPDRDRGPATLAGLLEAALAERGARPEVVEVGADDPEAAHAALGAVDAVVLLGDLDPATDARDAFAATAAAALGAPRRLLGVVRAGGASGLAGLLKAVHREAPDTVVRAVEVDPGSWPVDPSELTAALLDELADTAGPVEVLWDGGARRARHVVARDIDGDGDGDGLALGDGAVVLVTGGARGITASVATALASTTGCRLVLVGSSPLPGPEDPRLAEAIDAPALRQAVVALGEVRALPEVEATVRRTLADRQIRATLAELAEAGVEVDYHSLDVRDTTALTALVHDVVERHGRLDGVIHGAGILDDHLLADKTAGRLRPRVRHQGRPRPGPARRGARHHPVRRAVRQHQRRLRQPGPERLRRSQRRPRPPGGRGQPARPTRRRGRLGPLGRRGHGLARAGTGVRPPRHRPGRPHRGRGRPAGRGRRRRRPGAGGGHAGHPGGPRPRRHRDPGGGGRPPGRRRLIPVSPVPPGSPARGAPRRRPGAPGGR